MIVDVHPWANQVAGNLSYLSVKGIIENLHSTPV